MLQTETAPAYHRPLHIAAILTALLTFPLVWLGGLVTTHGAGLSVPDWPNSYGYNMFALPFSHWVSEYTRGTFLEHSHRLLGTLVGAASFTAAMIAWGPARSDRWRRRWGWAAVVCTVLFVITLAASLFARSSGAITEDGYRKLTHVFSGLAFLAVSSAIVWRCRRGDPAGWRRSAATAVLGAVIVQGIMGGFRVHEVSLLLAKAHGIFGQITFATAAVVAVMCSRWWIESPRLASSEGVGLRRLMVVSITLIALQLTLGALMRHDPKRQADASIRGDGSAGLAIPDWPLHYGKVLPPTSAAELAKVNEHRRWDRHWPPVSMGQVWLHAAHRLGAYATGLSLAAVVIYASLRHRREPKLMVPAVTLGVLVVVQITLGVLTVLGRKQADIATLHQAVGALLLMMASLLLVRTIRLYSLAAVPVEGRTTATGDGDVRFATEARPVLGRPA